MVEIKNNVIKFMFAGNSTFILQNSEKTNAYKIFKKKQLPEEKNKVGVYQCYIKNSNKNIYCGYFKICNNVLTFKHNNKYDVQNCDERLIILLDFIKNRFNTDTHLYHTGRCAHCGRMLTDSKSIERGFGPDCWKMIN